MERSSEYPQKMILDVKTLSELNSQGYAGQFSLGETVVLACGPWQGGPRYINEREAIYDRASRTYIERKCYAARKIID